MNENSGVDYAVPWIPGKPIHGSSGVGIILQSNHPDYIPGDLVTASTGWPWTKYFIQDLPKSESADKTFQKVYLSRICLFTIFFTSLLFYSCTIIHLFFHMINCEPCRYILKLDICHIVICGFRDIIYYILNFKVDAIKQTETEC